MNDGFPRPTARDRKNLACGISRFTLVSAVNDN